MKNLAVCNARLYCQDSTHNKSIWNQIDFDFGERNILTDLGFLWAEKEQANVILPY